VGAMEELLKEAPNVPGAYLYQLFLKKWPKLMEVNPYFESGRVAEAIPKLVEVLEIDPECPLTCFQLGFCFRATGELEKSESFYRQALRMAPDAGWIYSNLARTYQAMGEAEKAREAFWKALELLPGDHFVLEQLMALGELFAIPQEGEDGPQTLFVKRKDYEAKMAEALEKEKDGEKLTRLGWKLLQDRLKDLACRCFEKVRAITPNESEALLGLGTAHLELGRFKEAEKFLTEYLDENPESAAAHLNLFKAYLAQEERDLAWDEIQTAVRLDPHRLDSLRQLYFLFRETDRKEEGLEWMDRLALENPTGFAPLLVKAQALAGDQKWSEAETALKEALHRSPHHEEVLLFYTSELGRLGKTQDLIRLLEAESQPLPLSLTINLALAQSQTGQLEKGRTTLREYLKRPGLSPLDQARAKVILREFEK
jgi:tetratricopeptide (TPR) repeat protein